MRVQVPYLARLARQSTGQEALRPPRQLYPGETCSPARWPGADEPAWRQDSGAAGLAFTAGRPDGTPAVAGPRAVVPAGQTAVALPQPSAPSAAHPAQAQPPRSWPGPLWGTSVDLPRTTGLPPDPGETGSGPAAPVDTGSRMAPDGRTDPSPSPTPTPDRREEAAVPLPHVSAPSAAHAAQAQPPRSWPGPLWGTPVDLPRTTGLPPDPGETDGRGAFAPRRQPAAPAPRPGTERPADPGHGQDNHRPDNHRPDNHRPDDHRPDRDDAGIRMTPGPRRAAVPGPAPVPVTAGPDLSPAAAPATLDRLRVPAAAPDLLPPPAAVPRSTAAAGTGPDGQLRDPRASGQPRVSIGTIEVTVVPAAPAPETRRNQPSAPGRSRPASPPAADMAASGLQPGFRRWYGIAQG